jgi:hypothetical protein
MLTFLLCVFGWYVIGFLITAFVLYLDYKQYGTRSCDCWFFLFTLSAFGPLLLIGLYNEYCQTKK